MTERQAASYAPELMEAVKREFSEQERARSKDWRSDAEGATIAVRILERLGRADLAADLRYARERLELEALLDEANRKVDS